MRVWNAWRLRSSSGTVSFRLNCHWRNLQCILLAQNECARLLPTREYICPSVQCCCIRRGEEVGISARKTGFGRRRERRPSRRSAWRLLERARRSTERALGGRYRKPTRWSF
jgi:hypothetical protein